MERWIILAQVILILLLLLLFTLVWGYRRGYRNGYGDAVYDARVLEIEPDTNDLYGWDVLNARKEFARWRQREFARRPRYVLFVNPENADNVAPIPEMQVIEDKYLVPGEFACVARLSLRQRWLMWWSGVKQQQGLDNGGDA